MKLTHSRNSSSSRAAWLIWHALVSMLASSSVKWTWTGWQQQVVTVPHVFSNQPIWRPTRPFGKYPNKWRSERANWLETKRNERWTVSCPVRQVNICWLELNGGLIEIPLCIAWSAAIKWPFVSIDTPSAHGHILTIDSELQCDGCCSLFAHSFSRYLNYVLI